MTVLPTHKGVRMKLTSKKVERAGRGMLGGGDGLWLRVVAPERRNWVFRSK